MKIGEIRRGDTVRVALRAGHQLEPDPFGHMAPPAKPRRARGYSTTALYGFVLANDPQAGTITVNLQRAADKIYAVATIPYAGILVLQYVIPQGRPYRETAPAQHPGGQALGTRMPQLFPQPNLIRVRF